MTDSNNNETVDMDTADMTSPAKAAGRFALFIGSILIAILALGFTAGMIAGMIDRGSVSALTGLTFVGALLIIGAAGYLMYRTMPGQWLPSSPRMRKTQALFYVLMLLGLLFGLVLASVSDRTGVTPESLMDYDGRIPRSVAVFLLVGTVLSIGLSIRWHMLLDEHERAAYDFGGIAAIYTYFTMSLAWWIAWRGNLISEPDGYLIFIVTSVVWCIGWFARRYF